ncbi:MAG: 1-acyl-sn-glycerol-3-phosphate acyltransferase [Planctomycetaceae bacterium]|nr:1-acyl-sn-glycerol-3-phosphate acyltransferase [Planctomycetaceae bacterium]MCA9042720.1 1-acyl-sn-glycerol-3-phosphate acyltransferase [Planctomycetaceae bacterium]
MINSTLAGLFRLMTGAQPRWQGCEPNLNRRIYFANHCSNLDGPTIWATLPPELRKRTRAVAARDYWTAGPIRRYFAQRVFNTVLIERRKPTRNDNPIDDMVNAMEDGSSLILFPEGGRHPGPDPVEFKSGLYHLAKRVPEAELVPVLLDNLNRVLPKGELLPVPLICSVTFGEPIRLEENEHRNDFLARARAAVIGLRDN